MSSVPPAVFALIAFAAFGARAQTPQAVPPETVATAPPAAPAAASVGEQIDEYLKTSPALALPKDGPNGVTTSEGPRQVHGFVDVTVGSNGYRSAYVQSDLPVGKTGTLSIGVGESRSKGRFGGYGSDYAGDYGGRFGSVERRSLALGLNLSGDAADPLDPRCRASGEDGADLRPDPRIEGGQARACRAAAGVRSPPW